MSINSGVSPSRQYRVIMMTEDAEQKVELVTLPATLVNNPATVEIWYQKHVPKGHLIVDVEPQEVEPGKPETTGLGDSLNFTGEEPIEEDDKSEEDSDGEPDDISFRLGTPPKDRE